MFQCDYYLVCSRSPYQSIGKDRKKQKTILLYGLNDKIADLHLSLPHFLVVACLTVHCCEQGVPNVVFSSGV